MEKRVVIAIVLSLAVMLGYPYFLEMVYPTAGDAKKETPAETTAEAPNAVKETDAEGTVEAAPAPEAEPAPEATEELVRVETPLFTAEFSNIGGALRNFRLKGYNQTMEEASPEIDLSQSIASGDSLETRLVDGTKAEVVVFTPSRKKLTLSKGQTSELVLTGVTNDGLKITKTYSFDSASYMIDTEVRVENASERFFGGRLESPLETSLSGQDDTGYHRGPVVKTSNDLTRLSPDDEPLTGEEGLVWMGLEDKYFLAAMVPEGEAQAGWHAQVTEAGSLGVLRYPLNVAPGEGATYEHSTYMGPKEYDRLTALSKGLDEAIEFGFFSWLARPLLVALNFFDRYIGNYGFAIILLTVIIKVIFYPLTKHSLKSMKDLQKVQPQMAALKERYKNDKEKLNKELMDLYKRQKINPLGGCLPMLLQIPVFIGLYEVLYVAIELRHAPFMLWLTDLSAKDPYYVTPLLMGATMFLQQKMTPTSADPTQAKMMLAMPIVFTFLFLNFPSGLVIYWLVNNVLTIGQHYAIQKT